MHRTHDPRWGTMRREASLQEALGRKEAGQLVASIRVGESTGDRGGGGGGSGAGGASEGNRPEVVALLRAHGVSAEAAPRIAGAGEILRQRTAQSGVEVGAVLDADTGRPLGPTLEGQADRIHLESQLGLLRPGRRYVQLHTHPANTSLSAQDLALLLAHPEIRTMAAVGRDGAWHVLTKRRGQATASPEDGLIAWSDTDAALDARYDALIEAGTLLPEEAHRQQLHEVMQRIAPRLRLRYDRLER
ncbi:MAG TPA: hypothetical protein VK066_25650 [Chloroflexota bacterium]|nr:hypothetical protein [Chloroflexota bacterium]